MTLKKFDPATLYAAHGLYHNAVQVPPSATLVFSSGLIGADATGVVIPDPADQIAQAWCNVKAFIKGVGGTPDDLVRLKVHLTDRALLDTSKAARIAALGPHFSCAITGVITGLFDPTLVIEIDVVVAPPASARLKAFR